MTARPPRDASACRLLGGAIVASVALVASAAGSIACGASSDSTSAEAQEAGAPDGASSEAETPSAELLAPIDLPRNDATQGLSGTWFDASSSTLYAIQDTVPRIVPLAVSGDFHAITVGSPIGLAGRPGTAWDGEALTHAGNQFYAVTVETTPLLERFDGAGHYIGPIDVPAHFAKQAPGNKGLESLSIAPSGAFLFTANEAALTIDGTPPTKTRGTTIRILRRELATGHDEEHAYRTEPLGAGTGGDMGVSDVLAIGDTEILVLERGYQSDFGNTVRIFRVDYAGGSDVSGVAALDDTTPVLAKTLVVDIGTLPRAGITHPGTQPNPILDNYEGLALGPVLADGRRVVFVTSDDNASATQVARVLVLAVRGL